MKYKREQSRLKSFIKNLMQGASEEDIKRAEEKFRDYVLLAKEIHQRLASETKKE